MATCPSNQLRLNRSTVVSNIAALFSGSALSQGMRSVALLITARQLGVALYGQYAACFALTSFSSILFSLGLDIWLLREGSRASGKLGTLLGSVLTIKGIIGGMWLALVFLLSPLVDSSSFPVGLLRLSALSVLLDNLVATLLTVFKASLRNQLTSILESGANALWLLATLFLVGLGSQQAAAYVRLRAGAFLVSLVVIVVMVCRSTRVRVSLQTTKRAISEAGPFATSELLAWASMRVDVLIIAFVLGERATGLYSPAVGLVNALFLAPAAVYMVIMPVLSNLFVDTTEQAWVTARNSLLLLMVVGLGMSTALALGANPIASILGASFRDVQGILRLLSPVLFIHSLTFGLAAILVATDQQANRTVVQAIAVATSASLNLLVLPWAGVRGAAVVYIVSDMVLLIGYAWLVRNYRRRSSFVGPS
jgi:O-antigen/teichoic acid export membrane protein